MNRLKIWLGTLFGAGLLPFAPGTWGSLCTLPLVYGAYLLSPSFGILLLLLTSVVLSLWAAPASVEAYGEDPSRFVMDECAGQTLVFILIPFQQVAGYNLLLLAGGFILFRMFDILKPFGIKAVEKFSGKFGILADDLLAGVYALICLELMIFIFQSV